MNTNYFNVVALDDEATRWACQREDGNGVFETIGNFDDEEKATLACDQLNEMVEAENIALEEELAHVYGKANGVKQ